MKFQIPFTISSIDKLKGRSSFFHSWVKKRKSTKLEEALHNAGIRITREEYLSIVYRNSIITSMISFVLSIVFLIYINSPKAPIISLAIAFVSTSFIFLIQSVYPKSYNSRKQRNIEKNLIPALNDMYVQLNSGIPLFSLLVNISSSDYGELSGEFKKAVKQINAGMPEIEVLEEMGECNSSIYLRRTLWQISNGMRAGSDISIIIKEGINSLNEEQLIQIQKYGNRLNPLIMFYMLISVILPALSVTFLTIISSIINLPVNTTHYIFIGLFLMVVFMQLMFLGVIKSARPSLL